MNIIKKYRKYVLIAAMTVVGASGYVHACSFNTDCNPGSKCLKKVGQIYGACVGGMSPGRSSNNIYNNPYGNSKKGDKCSYNTDCDPGSRCLKESGKMYGACL